MIRYLWPIALVILSNVAYHLCAKSVPSGMNPFAALTVTYAVSTVISLLFYYAFSGGGSLLGEYRQLNWAPFVLGLVIIGLEVGFMFAYKAGWEVSKAPVVQAAGTALILVFLGKALFQEPITWNKILGVLACLGGLGLISMNG